MHYDTKSLYTYIYTYICTYITDVYTCVYNAVAADEILNNRIYDK